MHRMCPHGLACHTFIIEAHSTIELLLWKCLLVHEVMQICQDKMAYDQQPPEISMFTLLQGTARSIGCLAAFLISVCSCENPSRLCLIPDAIHHGNFLFTINAPQGPNVPSTRLACVRCSTGILLCCSSRSKRALRPWKRSTLLCKLLRFFSWVLSHAKQRCRIF